MRRWRRRNPKAAATATATASAAADKISSLPDEVLCRILSLVSTQEAVATSILSKRWIHLWRYLNNIDFTNIKVNSRKSISKLNDSVYSVLVSRDAACGGSHSINRFNLDIDYGNPHHVDYRLGFPNIVQWINLVVQRKLKHLRLHIHFYNNDDDDDDDEFDFDDDIAIDVVDDDDDDDEFDFDDDDDLDDDYDIQYLRKLPTNIFTCSTLVILDLRRFSVKDFSFSSIGFGFPSLKTLCLNDIDFTEDRYFMLLLFGCPVLEDLKLFRIYLCFGGKKSLTIQQQQQFKSLSLPKLIRADITQCVCYYFPLKVLSTSESICLDICKLYRNDREVYQVSQPQPQYDDIPIFHNLTYLELHNSCNLVVEVLHHCPKLQNLKLLEGSYEAMRNEDHQENWVDPEFVPQCLLSKLRTCTIGGLRSQLLLPKYNAGLQNQLMLAEYILKNANSLQTMKILSLRVKLKLSECPKASATCQLL